MFIVGVVCLIFALIFFGFALWLSVQRHQINHAIDEENIKKKEENIRLKEEALRLGEQVAARWEELSAITEKERTEMQRAFNSYCEVLDTYYDLAENEHDARIRALNEEYKHKIILHQQECEQSLEKYMDTLEKYYNSTEKAFDEDMKYLQEELEKMRATVAATKEAQRREEEMALQADFYSVHLLPNELDTISLINDLKPRIPEPRVLSMLIWTTYYQKQISALCNNVLGANTICGIYKITNKKSGMCYIGQATDIATRWKQHAKCGLGIDTPAGNKLYRAMQIDGLINFTFELLEECPRAQLNEKEKYYIDLYQSYTYGYNSTSGNK